MDDLRAACAAVSERARHVRIELPAIAAYARALPRPGAAGGAAAETEPAAETQPPGATAEELVAFWLTLDAINFGSGWFPTLRKPEGRSGYYTIALAVRRRFERHGPWSANALQRLTGRDVAEVLGQDPDHELMELFAASLSDLGRQVDRHRCGRFGAVVSGAGGSAVALARRLGDWSCFADSSTYDELTLPFLKRAQIVAADLARAGVAQFADLDRLTMFADNLVPHVLRLDGILRFAPALVRRIEREELIEHDSPEEVEIRACAVHAVELIVAHRPGATAAGIDAVLWTRGGEPRYKATPRHRSRCTAY